MTVKTVMGSDKDGTQGTEQQQLQAKNHYHRSLLLRQIVMRSWERKNYLVRAVAAFRRVIGQLSGNSSRHTRMRFVIVVPHVSSRHTLVGFIHVVLVVYFGLHGVYSIGQLSGNSSRHTP